MNRQRVNRVGKSIFERGVHQSVSSEARFAAETLGDDVNPEVAATVGCARVAGVERTLVFDHQVPGLQGFAEGGPDALDAIACLAQGRYEFSSRRTYFRIPPWR